MSAQPSPKEAQPKVGRGKRNRDRRYPTGFPVRCTVAEKREIYARAERACRSASRFLVELGLREGQNVTSPRSGEELSALEGLIVQLRRLCTNLSELIRCSQVADYQGDSPGVDLLREAVQEVKRVVEQVRARLA